jgi:hypothetical protein
MRGNPDTRSFDAAANVVMEAAAAFVDQFTGRHVAVLPIRHPELDVVDIDIRARIERGGSTHAQFLVDSRRVASTALLHTGVAIPEEAVDAWEGALLDPDFLYVTELRYRMLAPRVHHVSEQDVTT